MFLVQPEAKQVCRETNKMAGEWQINFLINFMKDNIKNLLKKGDFLGR